MTPEQLADKWIKEMQAYGFTPDEMLNVIALAKLKYLKLKDSKASFENHPNQSLVGTGLLAKQ